MKTFKPGNGLVKSRVRFTKCLYAMLTKQDFRPDRRSGWPSQSPSSSEYKAHSLGAKLVTQEHKIIVQLYPYFKFFVLQTTGFEIVLEQGRGNSSAPSSTNGVETCDGDNFGWLRYEEALKKTGYFRGYMEGSKPYQDLLSGAKDFYKTNLANVDGNSSASHPVFSWKESVCQEVKHLADTVKVDLDQLQSESETLPEDDGMWMLIIIDRC